MPKHEYGSAGRTLRLLALRLGLKWVLPPLLLSVILLLLGLGYLGRPMPLVLSMPLLAVCAVVAVFWNRYRRHVDGLVDPVLVGLQGERELAESLRLELGDNAYVIHDLDFGKGNVDHVVVAPAGVFTVETKAILGRVETRGNRLFINGRDRSQHLKQAFAEAMVVSEYLAVAMGGKRYFVTPLLAFTRGNVSAMGRCAGVYVMHVGRVGRFVNYEGDRLDWRERAKVAAALKLRTSEDLARA